MIKTDFNDTKIVLCLTKEEALCLKNFLQNQIGGQAQFHEHKHLFNILFKCATENI